ncbi:HAD family hydrolase [Cupriavidus sp. WKF15]|uniref:HAD family hydrolase n=1 Tax=Cupriavidus sp. WKF15 TaxID=3032282 RepID=UPI0023E0AFDB|nr:HAD family hydrolase [Cupriavidus sp. WKF15]WER45405.1 HAD family hydrolase [Cupriavidus sp. WKF15]
MTASLCRDSVAKAAPWRARLGMRFAQAAGIGLLALCAACGTSGGGSSSRAASAAATSGPKLLDPLPAWRDGAAKQSILNFVSKTTTPGSPEFVSPEDRIAVFDNDGTLWREDPVVELLFVVNRAQERARAEPALASRSPYKEFLADPAAYFKSTGEAGAVRLLNELYGNTSVDAFQEDARRYVASARHPKSKASLRESTYQPMLELLALLRAHGYQTWICSGGTTDFMRVVSQSFYGIPPQQVIGSRLSAQFREHGRDNEIWREPKFESFNDKQMKPVNIALQIGKRPVFAAGNVGGKGDIAMLSYSQARKGPSFQLLVNHDDAERESAYAENDGGSLHAASERGWTVVSMKRDWARVFPAPGAAAATLAPVLAQAP